MESATPALYESIQSRLPEHLDLLDRVVRIWSHADSGEGPMEVASHLIPLLSGLGFEMETVAQRPLPDELSWVAEILLPGLRQEDLGPTYAFRRPGVGEPVLLLGDLDSSYSVDAHRQFPIRREDGRWYGPAIADMKGGLVTLVAALSAIADLDLPCPPVEVILSCDEQAGSLGSRQVIEAAAERCPLTLCVECARQGGKLMAARGHIGVGELLAEGVEAHAGSDHASGDSAIAHLAEVIPGVDGATDPDRGVFVTVTMVEGGRRRSVVPGSARAVVDIRTASQTDWDRVSEELERLVDARGQGRVSLRTFAHRPGVIWTDSTDDLLDTIRRLAEPIGVPIEALRSPAAGSSAFAAAAASLVMDGMGPTGGNLMTPDEHIEIESLPQRAAILAATIVEQAD